MPKAPFAESVQAALAAALLTVPLAANAQAVVDPVPAATDPATLTYADLADLADAAPLVARAQVREVVRLKPEQARGVRPGWARLYVKARTRALLVGGGLGEAVSYLADVPLDAKGRPPKLGKQDVLLFASPVEGRPGELRLVAPDAQVVWSQPLEDRARAILTELVAPAAPPRVTAVREAMHVAGTLLDEGETQIFLATQGGDPVSITVLRRPGAAPVWGVALGEIVDQAARPPQRDTLTWYRLACFLPNGVTPATVLPGNEADRRKAAEDYRYVRGQLGACPRTRPAEWRRR